MNRPEAIHRPKAGRMIFLTVCFAIFGTGCAVAVWALLRKPWSWHAVWLVPLMLFGALTGILATISVVRTRIVITDEWIQHDSGFYSVRSEWSNVAGFETTGLESVFLVLHKPRPMSRPKWWPRQLRTSNSTDRISLLAYVRLDLRSRLRSDDLLNDLGHYAPWLIRQDEDAGE